MAVARGVQSSYMIGVPGESGIILDAQGQDQQIGQGDQKSQYHHMNVLIQGSLISPFAVSVQDSYSPSPESYPLICVPTSRPRTWIRKIMHITVCRWLLWCRDTPKLDP